MNAGISVSSVSTPPRRPMAVSVACVLCVYVHPDVSVFSILPDLCSLFCSLYSLYSPPIAPPRDSRQLPSLSSASQPTTPNASLRPQLPLPTTTDKHAIAVSPAAGGLSPAPAVSRRRRSRGGPWKTQLLRREPAVEDTPGELRVSLPQTRPTAHSLTHSHTLSHSLSLTYSLTDPPRAVSPPSAS